MLGLRFSQCGPVQHQLLAHWSTLNLSIYLSSAKVSDSPLASFFRKDADLAQEEVRILKSWNCNITQV